MSSILDALRKLEAAAPPALHAQPVPAERPVALRRTLGTLAVAFTAGVGLTVWMGRERPAPIVAHATPAAPAAGSIVAAEPLPVGMPRLAEAPVAVLMAEPPVPAPPAPKTPRPAPPAATMPAAVLPVATPAAARPPASASRTAPAPSAARPPASASRTAPAPPAAEPPAGRLAAVSPEAPVPAPRRPAPLPAAARSPAPAPPAEIARATPRASPAAPPGARKIPVLPRAPSDAPRVHLSLLVYSSKPARRTVTLSIDGGGLVTLREGETAGGISVERIFSDRAYLEHAGRVFLAQPRD